MSALAERLAARTLELVDIPSVSRREAEIAAHVRSLVPLPLAYEGDDVTLWATARRPGKPLVLLAGHYDTVPPQGNLPGRLEDGFVVGLGASDMKGGLAVMLELARDLAGAELAVDLGVLAFGKEELPADENPLPRFFDECALVHEAALVVLLEPTDNTIQAGCLGNMNVRLHFRGTSGHSARPWLADNALAKAVEGLAPLARVERREAVVGGLTFYEVLTLTQIEGGIATNVVPDHVVANVNFRYPPDRTPEEAEAYLRSLAPDDADFEPAGDSPPGAVVADSPLLARLREAGGFELEPKQAWTNVADFTSRGIDAVNLGPGGTRWAHARDERVEIAALVRTYEALRAFVTV